MSKPKVELQHYKISPTCDYDGGITVVVDGKVIAVGTYGGCPEDNTRHRDYSWVEEALGDLAKALGADVEKVSIKCSDKCDFSPFIEGGAACMECGESNEVP